MDCYFAVKWQYFLSQYHCLHLFSIKMLPYGNAWNRFSGWNSFMVIIPNRLHWKHRSVLCCLATPDSAACYFQHLSLSVWTPFSCRLYFCGPRSNTQETFLPVFPRWKCVSVSSYVPPLLQFLSSSHPERRSETFNNGAVGLLFCTVLSCRYCGLTVCRSTFHP